MRGAVAWCVRQPRTWVALAAAGVATALASGDGRVGWTAVVGMATFSLAGLSMRAHYLDEHPDLPSRADRARARHDAMVEASLRRYQGRHEPAPPPPATPAIRDILPAPERRRPTREERRQAKYEAWVEKTLSAHRATSHEERLAAIRTALKSSPEDTRRGDPPA